MKTPEEIIKENQEWAGSEEGKDAVKRVTGEHPYNKEEILEWDLQSALNTYLKEFGLNKTWDFVKKMLHNYK